MPHGRILGQKQTVHTLVQLHAELGGKLNDNRKQAERIAADMQHVEAVIRMFEPDFDVTRIAAKRRYRTNEHFKRGTIFIRALDVLRVARRPLTAREIAKLMLLERDLVKPNNKLISNTIDAVRTSFQNHEGGNLDTIGGHPLRWAIRN